MPCPSPSPRVHSNSRPSSQWCHPAISSCVVPFSSCPQSLPASVFSSESTLCMRWPKYWSFSFSIIPSKEISGLISFRMDWLDLLAVQGIPPVRMAEIRAWQLWVLVRLWGNKRACSRGKEHTCQCRRHEKLGFYPWVRKIPWRRAWHSTLVFLPGESLWTGEPGGLQSIESQRVGHDCSDLACTHAQGNRNLIYYWWIVKWCRALCKTVWQFIKNIDRATMWLGNSTLWYILVSAVTSN